VILLRSLACVFLVIALLAVVFAVVLLVVMLLRFPLLLIILVLTSGLFACVIRQFITHQ
jgi:hypothetical protein